MADTNVVNERSEADILVRSYDLDSVLSPIVAMEYRIDDIATETEIRDWVAVGSPLPTTTIHLESSDTGIVNVKNTTERKRLTTKTTYGGGDLHYAEYIYTVRALKGAP